MDPETGEVYHYPENTPVGQMTPPQVAEYWRRQARKHEARVKSMGDYDTLKATAEEHAKLVAASQTQHEREIAEARRQGQAEALTQASTQLVEQWVRAVAHQRGVAEESVNAFMPMIKPEAFLNAQGGVDAVKVHAFVNAAAPSQPAPVPVTAAGIPAAIPGQQPPVPAPAPATAPAPVPVWSAPAGSPDFGQGQPGQAKATGLEAGRELARQKFGTAAKA